VVAAMVKAEVCNSRVGGNYLLMLCCKHRGHLAQHRWCQEMTIGILTRYLLFEGEAIRCLGCIL